METTSLKKRALKRLILMVPMLVVAAPIAARPVTPSVNVQCVLVENAKIAQRPLALEGKFGLANQGHQIAPGTRNVLAIRIFDDPDRGPDSETFKKATLELELAPHVEVGFEVAVNVLRSNYVDGASGWVARGGYWWAKNPFHRVQFRRDPNGLNATLKQEIRMTDGENVSPRPPQLFLVNFTCPVRKSEVIQLTPWTGRVGTGYLSFYPQEFPD
jgi:hypothetical protein